MTFSPFAILTAEEMNDIVENIEALSAGTGFAIEAIDTDTLAESAVTADKTDFGGNYSTSEVSTGFTWTNGKTIYKKSVDLGTYPNNTSKNVAHGITNLDKVIKIEGSSSGSGFSYDTLGQYYDTSRARVYISGSNIVVQSNFNATALSGVATIFYTKSS